MLDDGVRISPQYAPLPLHLLRAEIARRAADGERPACSSGVTHRAYDTSLHVGALFLVLAVSTLACSFPLIVRRFPKLPIPNYTLFLSRHFGTGVLIATAFVHLLPTAYVNLTDDCLPTFWTSTYPAMSGFIAMVSVLATVAIEMFFATRGAGHSHSVDLERFWTGGEVRTEHSHPDTATRLRQEPILKTKRKSYDEAEDVPLDDRPGRSSESSQASSALNKPLPPEPPFDDDSDMDLDELDPESDSAGLLNGSANRLSQSNGHTNRIQPSRHVSFATSPTEHDPPDDAHEQRLVLQCLLLEAGILFHSVFIGMALSVSTGAPFVVLLIAISFHQTFEGLALGSRIASIASFHTSGSLKPWIMCLLYGITTPIGQAIGLAVQGLYDPQSEVGLLMVGIVNAVSAGLLIYAGLVQMLAEDFLSEKSYDDLQGRKRLEASGAVVMGSMLMALVGAFA
ncbi:zinc-regulated transporter 2 [Teratosphaeria nubilosa]|uniref:Zinc-regulated transporter 2 n=1 Tax=Teratosphaeria nubilosa TaxID=161662 RepID=A0A6G1L3R3_9PEZI|nr:zinc-regulated transporter 2 [Teratosphaeria nubilosa]